MGDDLALFEWEADGSRVSYRFPHPSGSIVTGSCEFVTPWPRSEWDRIEDMIISQSHSKEPHDPDQEEGNRIRRHHLVGPLWVAAGHMWGPPRWRWPRLMFQRGLSSLAVGAGWRLHAYYVAVQWSRREATNG